GAGRAARVPAPRHRGEVGGRREDDERRAAQPAPARESLALAPPDLALRSPALTALLAGFDDGEGLDLVARVAQVVGAASVDREHDDPDLPTGFRQDLRRSAYLVSGRA